MRLFSNREGIDSQGSRRITEQTVMRVGYSDNGGLHR